MKFLKVALCLTTMLSAAKFVNADPATTLNYVAGDYFEMGKALNANNSAKASEKAQNLIFDINTMTTVQMTETQHSQWFDQLNKLIRAARAIAQNGSIDAQKRSYSSLSLVLFDVLKLLNFKSFTVYKDVCDDDGYYWLSKTMSVKNPYHKKGGKNCGQIAEVLKPGK